MCDYYNEEDLNSWTVAVKSQYFKQNKVWTTVNYHPEHSFNVRVFPPHHIFAKTYYKLINFKSEEEANNFCTYFNSLPVTVLATIEKGSKVFGRNVPILKDYTSNNEYIDWQSDNISEQVCDLFGLNEIEKKIIFSDDEIPVEFGIIGK